MTQTRAMMLWKVLFSIRNWKTPKKYRLENSLYLRTKESARTKIVGNHSYNCTTTSLKVQWAQISKLKLKDRNQRTSRVLLVLER